MNALRSPTLMVTLEYNLVIHLIFALKDGKHQYK